MANTIDIAVRATDETGKAFDAATKRIGQFGGGAKGAASGLDTFRLNMEATMGAGNAFGNVLKGDLTQLDQLGFAIGRMVPQLAHFGAILGGLGMGVQLGKTLDEAYNISDRIAGLLTNTKRWDLAEKPKGGQPPAAPAPAAAEAGKPPA